MYRCLNNILSNVRKLTPTAQKWASHPDVVYARPLIDSGAKVVSSKDGLPTWIAEVMVTKSTVQEAIAFVEEVHRDILANVVTEAA